MHRHTTPTVPESEHRHVVPAVLGDQPHHYGRVGLAKDRIAVWEDGMRTDGSKHTFEWWYFDAELEDGSKLVITFFTKPFTEIDKGLQPAVTVDLDRPDGSGLHKSYSGRPEEFTSSREGCDVQIGPNFFRGNLESYTIHTNIDGLVVDVEITREVPSWRPATGFWFFGEHEQHYFSWLPTVPHGRVRATVLIDGERQELTGTGYHDHNWGNISMLKLIDNWYWARARLGDYTVIAAFATAEKEYGYTPLPVFMLSRTDGVVADDPAKLDFQVADVYTDDLTGKPVANRVRFDYRDEKNRYVFSFQRRDDIVRHRFIDDLHGVKATLARMVGFNGAYLRFVGDVSFERYDGETVVEHLEGTAIWELMYFGHVSPA